jgi:hypothetical protein
MLLLLPTPTTTITTTTKTTITIKGPRGGLQQAPRKDPEGLEFKIAS